jgi:hypothetical protein
MEEWISAMKAASSREFYEVSLHYKHLSLQLPCHMPVQPCDDCKVIHPVVHHTIKNE